MHFIVILQNIIYSSTHGKYMYGLFFTNHKFHCTPNSQFTPPERLDNMVLTTTSKPTFLPWSPFDYLSIWSIWSHVYVYRLIWSSCSCVSWLFFFMFLCFTDCLCGCVFSVTFYWSVQLFNKLTYLVNLLTYLLNSPVCHVWRGSVNCMDNCLLLTCSYFTFFSVGDSHELSRIQFTLPRQTRHRQDCFVGSGMAVGTYIGLSLVKSTQ